jgi:hypothetical protein
MGDDSKSEWTVFKTALEDSLSSTIFPGKGNERFMYEQEYSRM